MFDVRWVVSVEDRTRENIYLIIISLWVQHVILTTFIVGKCYDNTLHLGIISGFIDLFNEQSSPTSSYPNSPTIFLPKERPYKRVWRSNDRIEGGPTVRVVNPRPIRNAEGDLDGDAGGSMRLPSSSMAPLITKIQRRGFHRHVIYRRAWDLRDACRHVGVKVDQKSAHAFRNGSVQEPAVVVLAAGA